MIWGWIKGIISKFLFWIGLLLLFFSIYYFEIFGSTLLIISIIILLVASYLKYVSKQTVKNVDE